MSELLQILRRQIDAAGSISFARFMEIALYCPKLGYYETASRGPGRQGDYFTNVSVGPLFGRLLGCQFAEWLAQISSGPVQLVEIGAHQGDLARDILDGLAQDDPALMRRLQFVIVEPSPTRRAWQQKALRHHPVKWLPSLRSIPRSSVQGILFANELLDAFPVHRLGWDAGRGEWFEWHVRGSDQALTWQRRRTVTPRLLNELQRAGLVVSPELELHLPDGFTLEVSPQARRWWRQAAAGLGQGVLMTIDYGAEADALLSPARPEGTARAYRNHRLAADLLQDPGRQDLTAHVNFTQVRRAGHEMGLTDLVWASQERFLVGVLDKAWHQGRPWLSGPAGWQGAFQTLTHPGQMGRVFRVLAQGRGMRG